MPSRGAELIVREALRTDTELPLFVTLGAGLAELAGAYLMEPAIASASGPAPSPAPGRSRRARRAGSANGIAG